MAKNGKIILSLPDGSETDSEEINTPYVVGNSGEIHVPEIISPAESDRELQARDAFLEKQQLFRSVRDGSPLTDVYDLLLTEIAEEIGHLKFDRKKAVKDGKNPTPYTIARVQSLKQLAESLLKKKETLGQDNIDFKHPKIQKMFRLWMAFFYECMEKSQLDKSVIDLVFAQIQADLSDWEKKIHEELVAMDK